MVVCNHMVPACVEVEGESVTLVLPELEAEEEVDLEFSVSCDGGRTFSAPCPSLLQIRWEAGGGGGGGGGGVVVVVVVVV